MWPVRSGAMPPLADGFSARPETAPALTTALVPGAAVVLAPGHPAVPGHPVVPGHPAAASHEAAAGPADWLAPCGKTQLAVSAAESLWRSREVDLLVWVVANSQASVLSGYLAAAAATLGTDQASDARAIAARFLGWLRGTTRPWLVVLDDLSAPANLAGLMPAGPAGRVLVTTRDPAAVPEEHRAVVLPVGPFSPDEALGYLTGRLTAGAGEHPEAKDLVTDLGGEPLALAQASAVIVSSARTCRDYQGAMALRREEAAGGDPAAAAVTWALSAQEADRLAPGGAARALLELAALLDGHAIPAEVFTTPAARGYLAGDDTGEPATADHARAALTAAARAGLLTTGPPGPAAVIRMSAPVQAAIRAGMADGALEAAVTAAAGALLEAWPQDEAGHWLAGALRSCAASLQQAGAGLLWTGGCHPLLLRAGQSLDSARLTGPAIGYWTELADVSFRVLGRGHPDTLTASERLAGAYLAAGQTAQAIWCCESVLAERVRVLGPDHPSAIMARRNLGRALVAASRFGDAVTVLDRVAGDYERVRGADHADTLGAQDELAAAHLGAGQADEAIRWYRKTLAERERLQCPDSPEGMTTRTKLADAYLADGRAKKALPEYKRVLADSERVRGADHLDTIAVRGRLGSAYHAAGRMAAALQLYEQAVAGYRRTLGADHPDSLASSAALARAYGAVGRVTDATALLSDTLTRCEQALPPGDPLTEAVREQLASAGGG